MSSPTLNVTTGQVTGITNKQSEDFVSTYANNVAFTLNFFDIAMTFGELVNFEEGIATVEQKVRVVMSMAHAKLYALLMINQIQQYEQRFGPIPLPPMEGLTPEIQAVIRSTAPAAPNEG